MSFEKPRSGYYCVGGRHKSGTKKNFGEITFNKETGKEVKFLVIKCVIEIENSRFKLTGFNSFKNDVLSDLKRVK